MALNGGNVFRIAEQKGSHKVSIITTDTSSVLFHFCEQPKIKSIVFNDTQREKPCNNCMKGCLSMFQEIRERQLNPGEIVFVLCSLFVCLVRHTRS